VPWQLGDEHSNWMRIYAQLHGLPTGEIAGIIVAG
jgi:hypothetical protein